MTTQTAKIIERGNGLPGVGDHAYDGKTDTVYVIRSIDSSIQTGPAGAGNYIWAQVEESGCASDLSEEEFDDITCGIELADDAI